MTNQCEYDVYWQGRCKKDAVDGEKYCQEHLGKKCWACDNQAIGDCHKHHGSFICGTPMCQEHKHGEHN